MQFRKLPLKDSWILDLDKKTDERGFFARVFCAKEFLEHGLPGTFVQMNTAYNRSKGTLRGMHFQSAPFAESKLVRCIGGAAYDVMVDLRPDSSTFKQWVGIELRRGDGKLVFIPEGCAHGYLTLEDETEVLYFVSQFYAPRAASGYRYDDPAFSIEWPGEIQVLSFQDQNWARFSDDSH